MLQYHEMTKDEKNMVSEWKYDSPYDIYNNISYEKQIQKQCGFADPKNNFYTYYDGVTLVGYINLREKDSEVFLGVAVEPQLCNRGYGQEIAKLACDLSCRLYPGKPVCLEVRTWNIRAVKCYEKAGFCIVGEPVAKTTPIGKGLFYYMVKFGS